MNKTNNQKTILVKPKHGTGKKIAKILKCSTVLVSLALNGKVDSDKADRIRKMAIEMGGYPIYK